MLHQARVGNLLASHSQEAGVGVLQDQLLHRCCELERVRRPCRRGAGWVRRSPAPRHKDFLLFPENTWCCTLTPKCDAIWTVRPWC